MDLGPMLREKHQQAMRASRIKLGAMIALLIILLIVMFELNRWARKPVEGQDTRPEEEEIEGPRPPVDPEQLSQLAEHERPDFGLLTPAKAPAPIVLPKDAEKKFPFLTDPKTLDEVVDQNTDLEWAPFFHLLYRVVQDTPAALKAEAGEAKVEWSELWDKAPAWRGKAIRVAGQIMQMQEQALPENPMGLTKIYAYRLRAEGAPFTAKGHLYDVYAVEKLKGALRYDHVAADGRFLKARVSEPDRLDDPDLHVAVVLARAFEPLTYLDEPRIPGPIVDGNRAEARPLYWLLNRARKVPFEELKAQANPDLTYLDFVNRPERYRGKPVAVVGELRRLIRIPLPPDNILDMPDIFYGQVSDRDRRINTFYCIHVPEGLRSKDAVVLYGYFLKKWTYTSEGSYQVTSPILVAQRMRILDEAAIGTDPTFQIILVVVVGATAVIIGTALLLTRSRDRKAEAARRARELARVHGKLGGSAGPAEGEKPQS